MKWWGLGACLLMRLMDLRTNRSDSHQSLKSHESHRFAAARARIPARRLYAPLLAPRF
jgi:hypothetical protein